MVTRGGSAVDAVEAAVPTLEDDLTFDAGRGSVLNARGEVELDDIMMDGRDLKLGAVMAVKRVRHPITLARPVLTDSDRAILVSQGAEIFAVDHGVPLCPNWNLIAAQEQERYRAERGPASPPRASHNTSYLVYAHIRVAGEIISRILSISDIRVRSVFDST